MPDNGWRRRRRVMRHGGGQIIDEARAVVEAWRTAPHQPAEGLPEWLEDAGDAPGIGHLIDHTLLRPETGRDAILTLCDEAVRYGLKSVCVNGGWVEDCVSRLARSGVTVVTVVGFPLGAGTTKAKAAEARLAIGQAKSGEWRYVEDDIGRVVDAVGDDVAVSVILETGALEPVEMAAGCLVARAAGAAFVKSSTGFHPAGGATEGAISLLRRSVGSELGVKASGGVRTADAGRRGQPDRDLERGGDERRPGAFRAAASAADGDRRRLRQGRRAVVAGVRLLTIGESDDDVSLQQLGHHVGFP
jgi:deoxyribose-phosphate aldolase